MISVIIPTFRNEEELIKNLKLNLPFLRGCEVIVVNDNPERSIKNDLKSFPQIMLIENEINLGFAGAVHKGIIHARKDYILLLNSDVVLTDSSYIKALDTMKTDPHVFAVSFAQKENDGSTVGKNNIYWRDGFFQHKKAHDIKSGINGWAEGGSCMMNKKIYKEIGGFDSIFAPFYWEDIDLSYRAWKAGYEVLFNPEIIVQHHHESTIGKYFSKDTIRSIAYRNQFIFIWKNIEDSALLFFHIVRLLFLLPIMIFKDKTYIKGFCGALLLLPKIIAKRKHSKISDKEILNMFI
ncbi:glycosyltransferase family 2 protein [Candidatus Roizmanbacteria bacterium]|nr:glycosyltransferase family 2 protein [Candidatus Roizmanbacteria bacterium]